MKKIKEEILATAHREESSSLAREYFRKSGIEWDKLTIPCYQRLRKFIQIEIDRLLANEKYSMIKGLRVNPKIKHNKDGVFLTISGSYFSNRQAISFENEWVGFCAEMSGCNRIPFLVGFVNWVDWILDDKEGERK